MLRTRLLRIDTYHRRLRPYPRANTLGTHPRKTYPTCVDENQNPKNTNQNTKWAVKIFGVWSEYHNEHFDNKCPNNLLEAADPKLLDKWLSTFIVEIRRADGHPYPLKTQDNILSGLLRYILPLPLENPPNILTKGDLQFRKLLAMRDNLYKLLKAIRSSGNCLLRATTCISHSNRYRGFVGCHKKQRRVRSAMDIGDTRKRHS